MRASLGILALVAILASGGAAVADVNDLPSGKLAGYATLAVVENVVPVTSTLVAPRCLQGYILCKFTFAAFSTLIAGEQLLMSGGADLQQTRAILHRGYAGDWVVTPHHAAGELQPQVLPDPPPPTASADTPPAP